MNIDPQTIGNSQLELMTLHGYLPHSEIATVCHHAQLVIFFPS